MNDAAFWLGGALLTIASIVLLAWSWFHDKSRGRKRCPKCWYNMTGVEGAPPWTCSECGKVIKRNKSLGKTRRRRRWATLAMVGTLVGMGFVVTPEVRDSEYRRYVPNTMLILMIDWWGSEWAMQALDPRVGTGYWQHMPFINSGLKDRRQSYAVRNLPEWQRDWLHRALVECVERGRTAETRQGGLMLLAEYGLFESTDGNMIVACVDDMDTGVQTLALNGITHQALRSTLNDPAMIDTLIKLTDAQTRSVAGMTAVALGHVEVQEDRVLDVLTDMLASDDEFMQFGAVEALFNLRPKREEVKLTLFERMWDPAFHSYRTAYVAIRELGMENDRVTDTIIEDLASDDEQRILRAGLIAEELDEARPEIIGPLCRRLYATDDTTRLVILWAIIATLEQAPDLQFDHLGDEREEVLTAIHWLLKAEGPYWVVWGTRLAIQLEVPQASFTTELINVLRHRDPAYRAEALAIISEFVTPSDEVVAQLETLRTEVRGLGSRDAVKQALDALQGRDQPVSHQGNND